MALPEDQVFPEEMEKYRRIFHGMPDYATFSNLETGKFIDVNLGFENMTGYRREEVIGRTAASIQLWVSEEDRDAAVEALRHRDKISITTFFRRKDGTHILVEASLATFKVQDELLLVAVVRDITARHQAEQELLQYRNELERLVAQRTAELETAMERLHELTIHDEMTGVGNRRDLKNKLEMERQLFNRTRLPFSIAVLDLDGFKAVNDRFGHTVGDEVIKAFARIVKSEIRVVDYLARYGGDEFVVVMKNVNAAAAVTLLQRIRNVVETYAWNTLAAGIKLTTSIGVAAYQDGEQVENTFSRADAALYKAKLNGKNCIVAADS
ncbi:sensor domain-containing diguanylate cyclase [Noviherbaspirillum sp.]|uniref:sensor domain-containing diguanylate cyclase n=1 Tax=Noviherbaspirillum sp. TaxID=1926288 RepID=UPI002DDCEAE6|nr:sensor domain-containing diguanylate cyclase [Noviherbaspirillum sp.]